MAEAPYIIGLDISKSRTGVAEGVVGSNPEFTSIVGEKMPVGAAMKNLGMWLVRRMKERPIEALFYEAQIKIIPGKFNPETKKVEMRSRPEVTIALAKMVGVVEFVAAIRAIECVDIPSNTARATFLGEGFGGLKSDRAKMQAFELCKLMGWNPENRDESDAGAIWYCGAVRIAPQLAQVASPMLQLKAASIADGREARTVDDLRLTDVKFRVDRHGQEHVSAKDARRLFGVRA